MKTKTIISTIAACLAIFMVSSSIIAKTDDGTPIDIIYRPDGLNNGPRMPVFNPFYAYWEGSCVSLGSTSSYGTVSVCIVSTAGDYVTTGFDTDDGIILIPISGNTGHYILTIVTESGLVFEGEFDIY